MRSIKSLISSFQHQKTHVTAKRQWGRSHLSELECHHVVLFPMETPKLSSCSTFPHNTTFKKAEESEKSACPRRQLPRASAASVLLSIIRHDSALPSTVWEGEHFMLVENHLKQNNGRHLRYTIRTGLLITQNPNTLFLFQTVEHNHSQSGKKTAFAQNTSNRPVTFSTNYQPLRHLFCLGHKARGTAGYAMSFNQ